MSVLNNQLTKSLIIKQLALESWLWLQRVNWPVTISAILGGGGNEGAEWLGNLQKVTQAGKGRGGMKTPGSPDPEPVLPTAWPEASLASALRLPRVSAPGFCPVHPSGIQAAQVTGTHGGAPGSAQLLPRTWGRSRGLQRPRSRALGPGPAIGCRRLTWLHLASPWRPGCACVQPHIHYGKGGSLNVAQIIAGTQANCRLLLAHKLSGTFEIDPHYPKRHP